jgi:hypothetical protein
MSAGNAPFHAQEQPELPAWLETLRSGERSAMSTTGNAGASAYLAADLVDEGMLPSWMRPERAEHVDNTPSGAHPAQRPASAPAPNTDSAFPPARGMAASSLIDEQSLPLWMQGKQEESQYPGPENISAASLVQPGALPDWIRRMESQSAPLASHTPPGPAQYPQHPAQPISAHNLIDQQALPGWLAGQSTPSLANEQGFAASSLLDAQALPAWMREENLQQRQSNVGAMPPAQSGQLPHYQAPGTQGQVAHMNDNLGAASLVDANALPEWLRSAEDPRPGMASYQPGQSSIENPRQTTFGVPPRPDQMRVPSRPRGEMGYIEESEVAANTFASMLGVASVSPNFPGQQTPAQYQQSVPQPYSGPGLPTGSAQGQLGQSMPGMPSIAYPGAMPNQGFAPNQAQTPPGYQMGNMPGVAAQTSRANSIAGKQPGAITNDNAANANRKPAKRGFLSTILDWFSFSR